MKYISILAVLAVAACSDTTVVYGNVTPLQDDTARKRVVHVSKVEHTVKVNVTRDHDKRDRDDDRKRDKRDRDDDRKRDKRDRDDDRRKDDD